MELLVKKINFEIEDLENLPLFFKTIYYNEMSNLDDEEKLMRFNKKLNAIQMRHYEPSRIICKSVNTNNFKDKENEF